MKELWWGLLAAILAGVVMWGVSLLPKIGVAIFLFGVALFGASYLFGAMVTDVIIPQIKEMKEKKKWESGKC